MKYAIEQMPEWKKPRFVVGLDLGQKSDYSALCLGRVDNGPVVSRFDAHTQNHLDVVGLKRYPLRTSYPAIVDRVRKTMAAHALHFGDEDCRTLPRPILLIDATGVGAATVDMFLEAGLDCRIVPVTITSGQVATKGEWNRTGIESWNVPKKSLVSSALAYLETSRLRIAEGMEGADVLQAELMNFKVKVTLAGNEVFGASSVGIEGLREGQNDDLVLALAMVAWWVGRKVVDRRVRHSAMPRPGYRG